MEALEERDAGALEEIEADLFEVFSPPRVSEFMRKDQGSGKCLAFDLTVNDDDGEPWDLSSVKKRRRLWSLIKRHKPLVTIGSPHVHAFRACKKCQKPVGMKHRRDASVRDT